MKNEIIELTTEQIELLEDGHISSFDHDLGERIFYFTLHCVYERIHFTNSFYVYRDTTKLPDLVKSYYQDILKMTLGRFSKTPDNVSTTLG